MEDKIYNFPKQLLYSPKIENEENWTTKKSYLLAGMGGSHLQGDVIKDILPEMPFFLHCDYNLPSDVSNNIGVIAASFSGNTAETVSALETALSRDMFVCVSAGGGKLLEIAKENNTPYIQIPRDNLQPRHALGYGFVALAKLLGREDLLERSREVVPVLEGKQDNLKKSAQKLLPFFKGKIPVVYSSLKNRSLAYNWKIKFNETSKIPSFCNVFPELNHNEMSGFDCVKTTKELSEKMIVVLLSDSEDKQNNRKRMQATGDLLKKKGVSVLDIQMEGESRLEKMFTSLLLGDWISYLLAKDYGVEAENTPMVDDFKKMI